MKLDRTTSVKLDRTYPIVRTSVRETSAVVDEESGECSGDVVTRMSMQDLSEERAYTSCNDFLNRRDNEMMAVMCAVTSPMAAVAVTALLLGVFGTSSLVGFVPLILWCVVAGLCVVVACCDEYHGELAKAPRCYVLTLLAVLVGFFFSYSLALDGRISNRTANDWGLVLIPLWLMAVVMVNLPVVVGGIVALVKRCQWKVGLTVAILWGHLAGFDFCLVGICLKSQEGGWDGMSWLALYLTLVGTLIGLILSLFVVCLFVDA